MVPRLSLADGVENAAIICCFLTSDYEASEICKLELKYAHKRHKIIIPCMLSDAQLCNASTWLKPIIDHLTYIDISGLNIESKAEELVHRINHQSPVSPHQRSQSIARPKYLFEMIRFEYIRNSRIERFMNPAISYSIEQSYINLAIVDTKEHQEKEKQLQGTQNIDEAMGAFEGIYGTKTPIDIKDIFKAREREARQVLVFGRAGIGKSTFCRYAAYQWAAGAIWPEYDLVILIPLRSLTEQDYPAGIDHGLVDIVRKQYFSNLRLSDEDKQLLEEQIRKSRVLWLLDGYDELVQSKSSHLQRLIANLLKTSDHILTSRPYKISLSYRVQMEITGFIDTDIPNYIKQFFDQLVNEPHHSLAKHDRLLSFLKRNPRIWGIAHIPISLELICSAWSNTVWSATKTTMTMTMLYNELTEWICRRYLEKQIQTPVKIIGRIRTADVYKSCQKELAFLESLAFHGMTRAAILLGPEVQTTAEKESDYFLVDHPDLLNIGMLKSNTQEGIGTRLVGNKDYYFVHLSFQEYFAARYILNALRSTDPQEAIRIIQQEKYNQWFRLVFIFVSGLLSESRDEKGINLFWNTILAEPLDPVGIRHIQLTICCLDEACSNPSFPRRAESWNLISRWIKAAFTARRCFIRSSLQRMLRSCIAIPNEPTLQMLLTELFHELELNSISEVLSFISSIGITKLHSSLLHSITRHMKHTDSTVRRQVFNTVGTMGEKVATSEVISGLVSALADKDSCVRSSACEALGKMGEKAATSEVVSGLLSVVGDEDSHVRSNACKALSKMDEKAATREVISGLLSALGDKHYFIRSSACEALVTMREKAATSEVIVRLVIALGDRDSYVRRSACQTLVKMGEKVATSEVISGLVNALADEDSNVRSNVCVALGKMGEKAATSEVVSRLVKALRDADSYVRRSACQALGKMGEKAATSEIISGLVSALGDNDSCVRISACQGLGKIGEKVGTREVISGLVSALGNDDAAVRIRAGHALEEMGGNAATSEVIGRLVSALGDKHYFIRSSACEALVTMGEKAATSEVMSGLVKALGDKDSCVRISACQGLGKMGEKAATSEVISGLVSALGDKDSDIRSSACQGLGKMGEKAATSEVISGLVSALGDEDSYVRRSACQALGTMGEKAATSEVISGLVNALGDKHYFIRSSACEALVTMGEKAATSEVMSGLVKALGDKDSDIRSSACQGLGKMGEKAATRGVISGLLSALGDKHYFIRSSACEALVTMGEKAATSEVISGLVSALGDGDSYVRRSACQALGTMGEKAATSEVISGLVSALGDKHYFIRSSACVALVTMGEKAATSEVISGLVNALGDKHYFIRSSACVALVTMVEKAATSKVMSGLVKALRDKDSDIRSSACHALAKMGEKAATRGVISGLVSALGDTDSCVRGSACHALGAMGEKAATSEVIRGLVSALRHSWDQSEWFPIEHIMMYLSLLSALAVFYDKDIVAADAVATAKRCFET